MNTLEHSVQTNHHCSCPSRQAREVTASFFRQRLAYYTQTLIRIQLCQHPQVLVPPHTNNFHQTYGCSTTMVIDKGHYIICSTTMSPTLLAWSLPLCFTSNYYMRQTISLQSIKKQLSPHICCTEDFGYVTTTEL